MGVKVTTKGSTKNTFNFLVRAKRFDVVSVLNSLGRKGAEALANATPVDSGVTAGSWGYEINASKTLPGITWTNSEGAAGTPIVIMLQYGHGTGTGGYVEGRDFINPAIAPIFEDIADAVWKVVTE